MGAAFYLCCGFTTNYNDDALILFGLTNAKRCDIIIKLSDESMVRKKKNEKTFKKYLTNALTSDIILKLSERQQAS